MKRFVADALLIFALIVLGTMLDGAREEPAEDVNAQIAQFEEQVSLQRTWQGEAGSPMFYEVQENKASAFAADERLSRPGHSGSDAFPDRFLYSLDALSV
ncbi:MAG: hypothetical protein V8T10_01590 [Merdibacter sp.]